MKEMKKLLIYLKWLWIRQTRWRKYDTHLPAKEIKLRIEGVKITSEWWTPEFKELICGICDDKKNCNPIVCQVANPWCG